MHSSCSLEMCTLRCHKMHCCLSETPPKLLTLTQVLVRHFVDLFLFTSKLVDGTTKHQFQLSLFQAVENCLFLFRSSFQTPQEQSCSIGMWTKEPRGNHKKVLNKPPQTTSFQSHNHSRTACWPLVLLKRTTRKL